MIIGRHTLRLLSFSAFDRSAIFLDEKCTHRVDHQRGEETAGTNQDQKQKQQCVFHRIRCEAAVILDDVVYPVQILVDRSVLGGRTGHTELLICSARIGQYADHIKFATECVQ